MSFEKENQNVRGFSLRDLFTPQTITKLRPILMSSDEASNTLVRFNGQTLKAVWGTEKTGSYFILIEGEDIVAIRIKGDK